ncbi:MAG: zf-HC2 domain-containing protein [Myxococcota bacterium]|nr:zf-HC2 domain-containing protein [Myxococcota bacterium]
MGWTANKASEHPELAELHALARSECTEQEAKALRSHLESCPDCARQLAWIQDGLELLARPTEPDFNEFQWQAMENRLINRLETEQESSVASWLSRPVFSIFSWASVATALLLLFWISRDLPSEGPSYSSKSQSIATSSPVSPYGQTDSASSLKYNTVKVDERVFLVSGTAPYNFSKDEPDVAADTILRFQTGELHVREIIEETNQAQNLALKTEGFTAVARSRDFRLRNLAERLTVEVADGEVVITAPLNSVKTIKNGQRTDVTIRPSGRIAQKEGKPGFDLNRNLAEEQVRRERDTQVEVIPPPMNGPPISPTKHSLTEEIALRWVSAYPIQAPEHQEALHYLCDTYIERQQGTDARIYCEKAFQQASDPMQRYELNRKLGFIHKELLGDCAAAMPYLSKALVVANKSPIFSDPTRLARAECAIEIGQTELAKNDLAALRQNRDSVIRNSEVTRLLELLKTGQNDRGKSR